MKQGRWLAGLVFLACAALLATLPALAQDGDKWEWKAFTYSKDAKPFYQVLETKTIQTMKVQGQEVKQNQDQTFYISWTPLEGKDGNLIVQQKIIGVKMAIDIGGVNITYSSLDEKQPNNPMTDFFKKLLEADLKLTVDPKTMTVKDIDGHDKLVKSLGQTNPQMEPLLQKILSKDALTSMAEPTWGAFPLKGVKKGDPWTRTSKLDLGPIGSYETTYTYTYEGSDKAGEKVKIDASLAYTPPKGAAGLPFTIKNATLKSKSGTGVAYFDKAKGRFESSEMNMKLEGELQIEVGGMETKVDLIQDQTAKVTTSDTKPAGIK